MSDELPPAQLDLDPTWQVFLSVTPTSDGKFARTTIEIRRPTTRVPTFINIASSTDLLYERLQGEHNNALRLIVNEIINTMIKTNKHRSTK